MSLYISANSSYIQMPVVTADTLASLGWGSPSHHNPPHMGQRVSNRKGVLKGVLFLCTKVGCLHFNKHMTLTDCFYITGTNTEIVN
jgi:hypothetical protein